MSLRNTTSRSRSTPSSPLVQSLRTRCPSLSTMFGTPLSQDGAIRSQRTFNRWQFRSGSTLCITKDEYAWTTVSKLRGIMTRIYGVGIIHNKVAKNPVKGLETSTKTSYKAIKITPAQTLSILQSLMQNRLHFTLVFVVAATALRSSEVLALRWADILWEERKIRIIKSRKKTGVDGDTKTPASERDVGLGRVLPSRMAKANSIRETHGLRFPVSENERQGSNLHLSILRRLLATSGKKGGSCDPRRSSVGSSQPQAQSSELAREQGKGKPEDGAGYLGSYTNSDHVRSVRGRRPRRDDRGTKEVP